MHRHKAASVAYRSFTGCVASPGKCNPAAHGHMVSEEVCLVCGKTRRVAYNQSHVECASGRAGLGPHLWGLLTAAFLRTP